MSRRSSIFTVTLVAACGAAVAGTWVGRWAFPSRGVDAAPSPVEPVANLAIDTAKLNPGEVWETDWFEWTIPVTNNEQHPIEIKSFSATCNCMLIEPRSFTLGPGEQWVLRLQLDLTTRDRPDDGFRVWLVARLNAEASGGKRLGPEWVVSGRVRRALTVPEQVYLGRHSELSQPQPPTILAVEALVPLASLSVHSGHPGIEAVVSQTAGSSTYQLTLKPNQPFPIGAVEGWVCLRPVRPGGEALPHRRVRVYGWVVSDLEAQPPAVQVGGREVGSVIEEVVVLRSLAGRTLAGIVAEPEGEGLTAEPMEVPGEYRVRQSVRGAGTRTNQIRFAAEVDGRKVRTVVYVTYTGIQKD